MSYLYLRDVERLNGDCAVGPAGTVHVALSSQAALKSATWRAAR